MSKLSIVIPARNEEFLAMTVKDILKNMVLPDTEIIAVLDGQWADPPIDHHKNVNVVYLPKSVGQRAATNVGAKVSTGDYIMKLDAHCCFSEGFDKIMLDSIAPDVTMVPLMKNLHVFDWVCNDCEWRTYQGPVVEQCPGCGGENIDREIIFKPKVKTPNSTAYRFNKQLEFDYWSKYKKRQKGDLVETLSLQGSCWTAHKDKYWGLYLCDETWGSWGGQGAEVALKTWLSGGRVLCNKKTWYAHLFRTRKGFSFSYPNPGREQKKAKNILRDTFLNDKWEHAIHPLSWLIEKFEPIPDWHDE